MAVRSKSKYTKKKKSKSNKKARKTKVAKENARKAREARKLFIERVVEKSRGTLNKLTKPSPDFKSKPPPPQTSTLPCLAISEKQRKIEASQLKNSVPPRPHFLTTKTTIEPNSRMPGIEDMRGIATEMDAGMSSFSVYIELSV